MNERGGEGPEFRYFMEQNEYDAVAKLVDPMMSKDDPLRATGTRSMWFGVVNSARAESWKAGYHEAMCERAGDTVKILQLEQRLKRLEEREPLVQAVLNAWTLWTSQELYGELLREGMTQCDFEMWESTIDALRSFALTGPAPEAKPVDWDAQRVETAVSYILEGLRARSATPLENAATIAAKEVRRLREENDRLRRDRAEALTVHTKEGMLASEWVARTGRAEAEVRRLRTELERRNVAHVEPAILSKDRDEWKVRAVAAEAEHDKVRAGLAACEDCYQSRLTAVSQLTTDVIRQTKLADGYLRTLSEVRAERDKLKAEVEQRTTDVRHWRDECGKLNSQARAYRDVKAELANRLKDIARLGKLADGYLRTADEVKAERDRLREAQSNLAEKYNELSAKCEEAKAEREALREVIVTLEEDVREASEMLMVEMPEPGTPMARVMVANALMRRERDEMRELERALREQNTALNRRADSDLSRIRELSAERDRLLEQVRALGAKVARIEQLPARWRASFTESNEDYEHILMETCAEALEAALRGDQ